MIDYITTKLVRPSHLLYLGMDGVVVKAKMMQQRQRTAASLLMSDGLFDRTHVKPGTEFMTSLSASVKDALRARKKAQSSAWPKSIEFSDETQAGEGEHKIMARMRHVLLRPPRNWDNMIDVVYSPDADMGILTMLHGKHNDTTVVMRSRDKWNRQLVEHVMIGKKGNSKNDTLGDRWEFFNYSAIREEIRYQYNIENIQDLVVISCLAGNDFLPKLPSCRLADKIMVFDAILDCYRYTFPIDNSLGNLVDNNLHIQWDKVTDYIHNFTLEYSHVLLTEMNKQQEKSTHPHYQYTRGDQSRKWQVLTEAAMVKSKLDKKMSKEDRERAQGVDPEPDLSAGC
jgi:5'-3' exonuclease